MTGATTIVETNLQFAFHHRAKLLPRERAFVENVVDWSSPLTEAQREWLCHIVSKLETEAAALVARAVRIETEIERRNIKLKGKKELSGPCPLCGGFDRFSINTKKQVFHCRGCAVGGNVIKLVQHLDGVSFADAVAKLAGNTTVKAATSQSKPAKRDDGDDERRRLLLADEIWRAATPLGSDAVAYFAKRGIDINAVPEHGGLRFHQRCWWEGRTAACIIGRFTTAISNEPRGIWRRPISGEKPKSLGPMAGCVLRLWPDEVVEQGLVLGEGVETVISAATRITHRGTLLQPAWAACSAGNLENFPVLSGIEALTLLVDNDASGRGQEAAAKCAARWSAAGREVTRLTPKIVGADFNDLVSS
jgi:phage/plasmid primase-like uncharacterized protein